MCTAVYDLNGNQIGDDGVAVLASALRGGALPACTANGEIGLDDTIQAQKREDEDSLRTKTAQVDDALASPERATALARRQTEQGAHDGGSAVLFFSVFCAYFAQIRHLQNSSPPNGGAPKLRAGGAPERAGAGPARADAKRADALGRLRLRAIVPERSGPVPRGR